MREKLFGFQEDALSDLHKRINSANSMLLSDAEEQVIISFSAPTGSGKTIVMTALFEDIFFGSAETQGDPDAIIVWLSDMPELNEQSRRKIESKSDKIRVRNIHTIDSVFDSETLECGNIYFLNTQKLGSDKLLTHKSDKRQYTIWETLTNTAREYKGKLYLVIDEAHRGMNVSAKAENAAKSIMQKFIMGSAPDGLCKMPLVIGVTATPQRFHKLIENTESPELKVIIKPEDVRDSGLLKDRVVIHYPEIAINADMTMFQGAVASWQRKAEQWAQYCEKEREDKTVKPVLVIQVEDGNDKIVSNTEIESYLAMLETQLGRPLVNGEVVHCMDSKKLLTVGTWTIPYMEASRIEESDQVNFVIFKMSLSTGWDCPRAEVMMSFRSAQDYTYIAQLLGRMVRTPLARRIPSNDELNEVSLFLPYYNEQTVKEVVDALNSGEDIIPTDTVTNRTGVTYYQDPQFADVFADMDGKLITYRIETARKITPLRRLMQFCRAIKDDMIDINIHHDMQKSIVQLMADEIESIKNAGEYDALAQAITGFNLKSLTFDYGDNAYRVDEADHMIVTEFDIDRYFKVAGKKLGDGLDYAYWIFKHNQGLDDKDAKIEVVVLAGHNDAMQRINDWCEDKFAELYNKYRAKIGKLNDARRMEYERLSDATDRPQDIDWHLPSSVGFTVGEDSRAYDKHIYIAQDGTFQTTLNAWEHDLLLEEIGKGAYAWLRNLDRKPWSLCIPYRSAGKILPMYPDLLIVEKDSEDYSYSILEPHDPSRTDNVAKAVGLAEFADKHQFTYNRIQLIRKKMGADRKEHFYRLDMAKVQVRNKVKAITDNAALDALFDTDADVDV